MNQNKVEKDRIFFEIKDIQHKIEEENWKYYHTFFSSAFGKSQDKREQEFHNKFWLFFILFILNIFMGRYHVKLCLWASLFIITLYLEGLRMRHLGKNYTHGWHCKIRFTCTCCYAKWDASDIGFWYDKD